MRRGNISGTRKISKKIYIYLDAGGSKSTRVPTRDQQYICVRLIPLLQFLNYIGIPEEKCINSTLPIGVENKGGLA